MAKRFTDTGKWGDSWFRELPPVYKCLWIYICDNCDISGIWKVDMGLAIFQIGAEVLAKQAIELFNKDKVRITELENAKWFLPGFVPFQYGMLKPDCSLHASVIFLLCKNRVTAGLVKSYVTVKSGSSKGDVTPKDITKVKEKDKNKVVKINNKYINNKYINKNKYLEFVYLNKNEYDKLTNKFGLEKTNSLIERLNNGIGSKGYKYESHYHTILNWERNGEKNANHKIISSDKPEPGFFAKAIADRKLAESAKEPNAI